MLPENADDGVRGLTVDGIHDAGWSPAAGHIGPAAREPWPLSPAAEPELAALTEVFARRGLWPDEGTLVHELRREAERLLPCDRAIVALCGRGYLQIFERSEGRESFVLPHGPQTLPWQACQMRELPEEMAGQLGARAGIQAPLRIAGRVAGSVAFLFGAVAPCRGREFALAERIAGAIASLLARRRAEAAEAGSRLSPAWSEPLVQLICESPDVHRILPAMSTLLAGVVPHDRLSISYHDGESNIYLRSASNLDGPGPERLHFAPGDCPADGASLILNDLPTRLPRLDRERFNDRAVDAGYRSFLVTHVRAGGHGLGFAFWSKQPDRFRLAEVPLAQRIAELCAVSCARQPLAAELSFLRPPGEPEQAAALENAGEGAVRARPASPRSGRREASPAPPARRRSEAWVQVLESVAQVAPTGMTVLLTGETGTGKEVVARTIWEQSSRSGGPFVAVNCAALPETLFESELFGFERGAFTSAHRSKPGHIEMAHHGVLFLDELSQMSLSAQAKLLRVLETRQVQPLGSTRPRHADIRILAATNSDLREEIAAGRFRSDLYYRLSVWEIRMPPLRSRPDDVLPLCYEFLAQMAAGPAPAPQGLSREAEDELVRYPWPGNVRELRNVIERAAVLCRGGVIEAAHLGLRFPQAEAPSATNLHSVERDMIERVMRECGGNKARAAKILGLSRTQLYVRLRRYFPQEGHSAPSRGGVGVHF